MAIPEKPKAEPVQAPEIRVETYQESPRVPGPSREYQFMSAEDHAMLVADLKQKHGPDLIEVPIPTNPDIFVIARRADRAIHRARKADRNHEVYKDQIDERLCAACVVWPDQHRYDAILEKYPYFSGPLAYEIIKFSGGTDSSARKL
jgi:hypothetical protein